MPHCLSHDTVHYQRDTVCESGHDFCCLVPGMLNVFITAILLKSFPSDSYI